MKISNGKVTYNSYYLKNGKELIKHLQSEFYILNVEYAKKTILTEFESQGFSLKKDYDFVANEEIKEVQINTRVFKGELIPILEGLTFDIVFKKAKTEYGVSKEQKFWWKDNIYTTEQK